jgi:hypothetical protein
MTGGSERSNTTRGRRASQPVPVFTEAFRIVDIRATLRVALNAVI